LVRILTAIFITVGFISAQIVDRQAIIESGEYYYGTGTAPDANEARDRALARLTAQIAVTVESSFSGKLSESGGAVSDEVQSILKTHSAATLKNVEMSSRLLSDDRVEVFCWIAKAQVATIFQERRNLVASLVRQGDRYRQDANIAYALKLYYFSLLLMNSIPDVKVIVDDVNYTLLVPERINELLLNLSFRLETDHLLSENEREITLSARYHQTPVSLLDFTFWAGAGQAAVQARDGMGTFRLLGSSTDFDRLKLSVKYAYYECRDEFQVISRLWDLVLKPRFDSSKTLSLTEQPATVAPLVSSPALEQQVALHVNYNGDDAPIANIMQQAYQFLETLLTGDPASAAQVYRQDAYLAGKVGNYMRYNHPRPLERYISAAVNPTDDGWELRRIRVAQDYPGINRETSEYLVLDFSPDGQLVDLNLAISALLYEKLKESGKYSKDWDRRREIIRFVEKYRTAYQTRDIGTIDKLFSEDALIIKGRVLETRKLPADLIDSSYQQIDDQPAWEEIRFTKDQFLSNEQRIFDSQQDLLVEFSSFDIIRKNNAPGVYGVEMRQNYTVTTYQDEGYLFLLIDFNEPDPLIYVRAWQPNCWDDSQLIRTANFKIHH